MTPPMLEITNVTKRFPAPGGAVEVLSGVSLSLNAQETLALTGESGSGKSTLLHLAAALDEADSGTIAVAGTQLAGLSDAKRAQLRRTRIGLVFQQFNLIPSLDVAGNLGFQARLAGRHDADFTGRLAERLGIAALLHRYPEDLSGGQQQRVAIGRALAARPGLILADEPTGNLDEDTGAAVLALLLELVAETGAALMVVTHSAQIADALDRRAHLSHGQLRPVAGR